MLFASHMPTANAHTKKRGAGRCAHYLLENEPIFRLLAWLISQPLVGRGHARDVTKTRPETEADKQKRLLSDVIPHPVAVAQWCWSCILISPATYDKCAGPLASLIPAPSVLCVSSSQRATPYPTRANRTSNTPLLHHKCPGSIWGRYRRSPLLTARCSLQPL
jgi:hypothetical protein